MSTIEKLTFELDTEMNRVYAEYIKLHEELNSHRGKIIEGPEHEDEVNRILKGIQQSFNELYVAYHFITYRHQYAVTAVNEYTNFIESLKKAGLKYVEKEEPSAGENVTN
jgi:hypothetical protein